MEIPPRIRIPQCIEQGSVFNFKLEVSGEGRRTKNRYFVVLNRNPKADTFIILVTSTSQISKKLEFAKRAGISEQTIVVVSHEEYNIFSIESAFNCNDIHEVKMSDLVRKIEEDGSIYNKIPDSVLVRIIAGVNLSPRVAPSVKKLL